MESVDVMAGLKMKMRGDVQAEAPPKGLWSPALSEPLAATSTGYGCQQVSTW